MPHQCVRCGEFYDDGSSEILKGCPCGGRLFFFIKKEKLNQIKKDSENSALSKEEKHQMEKDILDMVGADIDKSDPVVLDLESVNVIKPGKYELDLVHLFKNEPLIFKLEEGKYIIDIIETLNQYSKIKKK